MDKKQTEALRIATESLPMLKIAASLGDETGQISFHSSHLLNLMEGYDAARQEIASLRAQPYDQQAMGLCHICGWKGVIDYPDGPVCVACEHDKTLSPQPAAQPTIVQMKEYCKQASAMMARDLTRFDAACEVMGYLKEMRAPGYYMHRMNIVLHGNVEGTDAARASDKAPQPTAQAQDDAEACDTRRLNFLESRGCDGWIARMSTTGRGYRLHQSHGNPFATARDAIDAAIAAQQGDAA